MYYRRIDADSVTLLKWWLKLPFDNWICWAHGKTNLTHKKWNSKIGCVHIDPDEDELLSCNTIIYQRYLFAYIYLQNWIKMAAFSE